MPYRMEVDAQAEEARGLQPQTMAAGRLLKVTVVTKSPTPATVIAAAKQRPPNCPGVVSLSQRPSTFHRNTPKAVSQRPAKYCG